MSRTVIKLGSSIVARDTGELRADVLARICDAAAARHHAGDEVLIVSSGAIARGMRVMGLAARPRAIEELQASSAVGQGSLYRAYDELLGERDVLGAQVLLTFSDLSVRGHYLNARRDNDFLAAQVAILVGADLLVLLTHLDGLYSADPHHDQSARLVDEVADFAELESLDIAPTTSALGSGGMRSKVVAADMATAAGIPTVICDGLEAGALEAVLTGGRAGTRFHPRPARYSSFKLWLKYAKPSLGTLTVDAGAVRALREAGTSLLPVGVVEVDGAFGPGDAVDIIAAATGSAPGSRLGKGICNYSAGDLRRVRGLKSAAAREVVPRAPEEAVHRDYLVLE